FHLRSIFDVNAHLPLCDDRLELVSQTPISTLIDFVHLHDEFAYKPAIKLPLEVLCLRYTTVLIPYQTPDDRSECGLSYALRLACDQQSVGNTFSWALN